MTKPSGLWWLAAMLLAVLVAGCASKEDQGSLSDDEFEKWRLMAEQSQGHSPSGKLDVKQIEDMVIKTETVAEQKPVVVPDLPKFKVTLRMHDADLVAVLQALSRAAKQSIVVSPQVSGVVNINIVQTPWDQVFKGLLSANLLAYKWEGNIIRVMTAEDMQFDLDMDVLRRQQQAEKLNLEKAEPMSTSIVKVKFSEAALFKESLAKFLSKDGEGNPLGSIEVDEHTNSLIIQAIKSDMDKLIRIVANLDAPREQIKLKAHIVETTRDTARALGVQWGGSLFGAKVGESEDRLYVTGGGTGEITTNVDGSSSLAVAGTQGTGTYAQPNIINYGINDFSAYGYGTALSFGYGTLGQSLLELQLQMLEEENKLRIISSPSITTMDNQKAYTESGERVPYQTTESSGGTVSTSVEFEEVVLRLEITPHIIDDQFLKLSVLIKKDEVDSSRTVDGNPYILRKQTETTLIARNGETVVISGLSKNRSYYSEQGMPYLKDVPYLKRLFGSEATSNLLDEFMIFITPEVLAEWKPGERQKTVEEIGQELLERREKERREAEGADAQEDQGE